MTSNLLDSVSKIWGPRSFLIKHFPRMSGGMFGGAKDDPTIWQLHGVFFGYMTGFLIGTVSGGFD